MKTLADKLRELESELLAEGHDASHPVLREISEMVMSLETSAATYHLAEDGETVVRVPNERR